MHFSHPWDFGWHFQTQEIIPSCTRQHNQSHTACTSTSQGICVPLGQGFRRESKPNRLQGVPMIKLWSQLEIMTLEAIAKTLDTSGFERRLWHFQWQINTHVYTEWAVKYTVHTVYDIQTTYSVPFLLNYIFFNKFRCTEPRIHTFGGSGKKSLPLRNWLIITAVLCSPKAEETTQYPFRFYLLTAV